MKRILGLEAYYGGSHKAFLDGWIARSGHEWTLLTLEPYKWKWRMRHSAVTFAEQVNQLLGEGQSWDVLFCSDMLNLAEFRGLADEQVRTIPAVVYFHENQLTYPVRFESERDYQFGMTNMTTALAANRVWFNSAFHRDEFLAALEDLMKRMPDNQPLDAIKQICGKSCIQPPGIELLGERQERQSGPIHILWAARWEHDKNPEDFFAALKKLEERKIDFKLSVIGESFRDVPEVFAKARKQFAKRIVYWGYQDSREDYVKALLQADVVVSTAHHEFFGIGMLEAVAAGAYPLLPKRLSYPEIFGAHAEFFYECTVASLAEKLQELAKQREAGTLWGGDAEKGRRLAEGYAWPKRAAEMDRAIEGVV